jgi:hypothetical protein
MPPRPLLLTTYGGFCKLKVSACPIAPAKRQSPKGVLKSLGSSTIQQTSADTPRLCPSSWSPANEQCPEFLATPGSLVQSTGRRKCN